MMVTMTDFTQPGSKVIVPTPAYMPFLFLPKLVGREHIEVPCHFNNGRWELDYEGIDAAFERFGQGIALRIKDGVFIKNVYAGFHELSLPFKKFMETLIDFFVGFVDPTQILAEAVFIHRFAGF